MLNGQLRVPDFQRGWVWTPQKVAFLLDSIFRGYPIGQMLVWRTKEKLVREKALGVFELPEPREEWPIDYVLDGQQRITALFGVFQTQLTPHPAKQGEWLDIYFDMQAPEGAFQEQFVPLLPEHADGSRHFPLRTLFEPVEYRKAIENQSREEQQRIDRLCGRFTDARVTVEVAKNTEPAEIAIIFGRINRAQVHLNTFQLLSAWTWNTDFDLRGKFQELSDEVDPFGFSDIYDDDPDEDPDLLLKCCAAVIAKDPSSARLIDMPSIAVRERFQEIRAGILRAIDFLRELNINSLRIMPYPTMIIPLTSFFAALETNRLPLADSKRAELTRWFWRSCFARRYSSGTLRALCTDIASLSNLALDSTAKSSAFACEINENFFLENIFNLGSVNTRTYVTFLAQMQPLSFLSGGPVSLNKVLSARNRAEFHHIFPRRHLDSIGVPPESQSVLANMCFLSNADNHTIRDKSPHEYRALLPADRVELILDSHGCSADMFELPYREYLHKRAALLRARASVLLGPSLEV